MRGWNGQEDGFFQIKQSRNLLYTLFKDASSWLRKTQDSNSGIYHTECMMLTTKFLGDPENKVHEQNIYI